MKIRTWSNYLYIIFFVVLLAIVLRWTTVSFYYFPTDSMVPSIYPKEYVLVNKLAYGLRLTPGGTVYFEQHAGTGDLVLFTLPNGSAKAFVRRVIAVSGEFVEIKNGKILINDKVIEVSPAQDFLRKDFSGVGIVVNEKNDSRSWLRLQINDESMINYPRQQVPEGHLFVLNDNRIQLEDSRSFGMVPVKYLLGKVATSFRLVP